MTGQSNAVVMCADSGYLPYALFLAWQIRTRSLRQDFDVIITSTEPISVPDSLQGFGIEVRQVDPGKELDDLPLIGLPATSYLRLFLPKLLGGRYQRLLYLDCDMWFDGGDLGRLMRLDLGGLAVGAVRDAPQIMTPSVANSEYFEMGLPNGPYYNAGLLLIDTAAYVEQRCLERMLAVAKDHPAAVTKMDQSLINLALRGELAELSPVWNWGINERQRIWTDDHPIRIRHFIGTLKPWHERASMLSARWREGYKEFFEAYLPEAVAQAGPDLGPKPAGLSVLYGLIRDQVKFGPRIARFLARFKNEWDVLT